MPKPTIKTANKNPSHDLAIKIIDESFDLFSKKHFEKILQSKIEKRFKIGDFKT